ncbi:MAG: DNA adenine methylase [Proteobacteria bacterium]|nr:DNA adenine methylase [Pseudomonadota bacterium]
MKTSTTTPSPSTVAPAASPRPEGAPTKPFLKWVGGKRQLLKDLLRLVPRDIRHYHEPFLGGGALFFALRPSRAHLADSNAELIRTYTAVRDDVEGVIRALQQHRYQRDHYYKIRATHPDHLSPNALAARMIYLNRCGYNGLYRVNRQGLFNVPFGRYNNPKICDADNLRRVSLALQGTDLTAGDFAATLAAARRDHFVYLDPPYIPVSATASFVAYQQGGFGMDEQEQLARTFEALDQRGVRLMLSNSDVPWVRQRYADYRIHNAVARRPINSRHNGRGPIPELIVTNY